MRMRVLLPLAVFGCVLAAPATAAARAPAVTTGGVANVTSNSALLKGTVNPEGKETAYYFQIGTTKAYGGTTTAVNAGSGTSTVSIAEPVGSLAGFTTYHYRIVGVSSGGTSVGSDQSFTTLKIPLSLQIAVAPNPVPFLGTPIIEGTLAGTGNANRQVVLESNPFPYTAGFHPYGNVELTTASGSFGFAVVGLSMNSQFVVVTTGHPTVSSPVVTEGVAIDVVAHIHRARGRNRLVVSGTVSPAMDGALVAIEKINRHNRYVTVGGTNLVARNATSSRFSKVIRVHRAGIYRVLVQTASGAYVSNYSVPLAVR